MELKFLKEAKDEVEVEFPDLTLVEILRVYLNKDSDVTFAAWKREHYTKKPVLKVKAKDAKAAIKDAIKAVNADLDSLEKEFKTLK
ncbi:hypothetical protein GW932_01745 [archaeon]|nr:hypothetical protein [archaeon]